jgi:hypothetical protein
MTTDCGQHGSPRLQQIVDERNLIVHVAEFEADPGRRPLSRTELQAFFDHCDAQVSGRPSCAEAQKVAGGAPRRGAVQDNLRAGIASPGGREA